MTENDSATQTRLVRQAPWNGPPLLLAAEGVRVLIAGTGAHRLSSSLPQAPAVPATLTDLGQCLVERAGLNPANLTVLLDPATPANLGEALAKAAQEATSALLFYYVGHGVFSPDNELHLATRATVNLAQGVPGYQALPYAVVRDILATSRAERSVVVLDCCFRGSGRPAPESAPDPTWRGAYLLTSSSRDENAWALPGVRHTALSGALLRLLNEGEQGGPASFTLDHVYERLARSLPGSGFPRPRRTAAGFGEPPALAVNPAHTPPSALPGPPVRPVAVTAGPYQGLAAYGPEQSALFFGREDLTRWLTMRARQAFGPGDPLIVTGSPGCGKSSVLRAGVLPALRKEMAGEYVVLVPGADPLTALARELARLGRLDPVRLRAIIESDSGGVRRALPDVPGRLLVLVDQFEELFTACESEQVRRRFVAALVELAKSAAVVIAVRADYFGRCAAYPGLLESMRRPEIVVPMSESGLRSAIEEPAARSGLSLEAGLTDLILADVRAGEEALERSGGVLPLLSQALLATWQRRMDDDVLAVADYQAAGGVARALAMSAEESLRRLGAESEQIAQELLTGLVRVDERGEASRRRVPLAELLPATPSIARQVLGEFVRARLVTVADDVAELTHEALITAWPRLASWIGADRAGLLVRRRLTEDAEAWQQQGQPSSYLYADARLAAAQTAVGKATGDQATAGQSAGRAGTSTEREFLRASARRQRRRSLIARGAIAALTVLFLVAAAGGVVALLQSRAAGQRATEAAAQRDQALSRQIAAAANSAPDTSLGAQLALSAYRLSATPEARGALLGSLTRPIGARMLGHTAPVESVAYRSDGRVVASASADATARLWNVADPLRPKALGVAKGHTKALTAATFNATGKVLATGSADETARLWNVSDTAKPKSLATLKGHTDRVTSVAFSPKGDLVATASADKSVRLWNAIDPAKPKQVSVVQQSTALTKVAFSPDGRIIAITSTGGTLTLLDVLAPAQPSSLAVLTSQEGALRSVAFAPNGRYLATAAATGAVQLWDITAAKLAGTARGHQAQADDVVFSPDGDFLASASADATVGLWDVEDPRDARLTATLTGFPDGVTGVAFSPNGQNLATSAADGTARLWNVANPARVAPRARLTGHTARVNGLAITKNGRTLATASDDKTVKLWDLTDPAVTTPLSTLSGHTGLVLAASFSPDGRRLATASLDGTVRLWDLAEPATPKLLGTLTGHTGGVRSVVYSPDGRMVATTGRDGKAALWNVAAPAAPKRVSALDGVDERIGPVAFSPDGRVLATGSGSASVRLWDVSKTAKPRRLADFTAHAGGVLDLRFSKDGKTLATAATDGTARLWDVAKPERPQRLAVLQGHASDVTGVAFNADGTTLATGSQDTTIRIWNVSDRAKPVLWAVLAGQSPVGDLEFSADGSVLAGTSGLAAQLWGVNVEQASANVCEASGTAITQAEWAQYVPGRPYKAPCP
jgi:WD40 repeat protein